MIPEDYNEERKHQLPLLSRDHRHIPWHEKLHYLAKGTFYSVSTQIVNIFLTWLRSESLSPCHTAILLCMRQCHFEAVMGIWKGQKDRQVEPSDSFSAFHQPLILQPAR